MTAYIKLETLEYPRHVGDIALDPDGTYVEVQWVDRPIFDKKMQYCYETTPVNVDGSWSMTWQVRDKTQEELDAEQDVLDKLVQV
jgi:hypothetical protein